MNETLNKIKQAVYLAIPSKKELKFGCEVKARGGIKYVYLSGSSSVGKEHIVCIGGVTFEWSKEWFDKNIEIIGTPITLADVLYTIKENADKKELDYMDIPAIVMRWNLLNDNLDNQSSETLEFISNLISTQ